MYLFYPVTSIQRDQLITAGFAIRDIKIGTVDGVLFDESIEQQVAQLLGIARFYRDATVMPGVTLLTITQPVQVVLAELRTERPTSAEYATKLRTMLKPFADELGGTLTVSSGGGMTQNAEPPVGQWALTISSCYGRPRTISSGERPNTYGILGSTQQFGGYINYMNNSSPEEFVHGPTAITLYCPYTGFAFGQLVGRRVFVFGNIFYRQDDASITYLKYAMAIAVDAYKLGYQQVMPDERVMYVDTMPTAAQSDALGQLSKKLRRPVFAYQESQATIICHEKPIAVHLYGNPFDVRTSGLNRPNPMPSTTGLTVAEDGKICGIKISARCADTIMLQPSRIGLLIKHGRYVIAEWIPATGELQFYLNVAGRTSADISIINHVVSTVLAFIDLSANDQQALLDKQAEENSVDRMEEIKQHVGQMLERKIEATKQVFEQAKIDMDKALQEYRDAVLNFRTANVQMDASSTAHGKLLNHIMRQMQDVNRNPMVESSMIKGQDLLVFTKHLISNFIPKDRDGRYGAKYDIGKCMIKIPLTDRYNSDRTFGVRVHNLTRKVHGFHPGMNAAHIYEDGRLCPGSISELLPELLSTFELDATVSLLIELARSANTTDGAGLHIDKWPVYNPPQSQQQQEAA